MKRCAGHLVINSDGYLSGLGLDRGQLVIFDLRTAQPSIRERTHGTETTSPQGRRISVVRAYAVQTL